MWAFLRNLHFHKWVTTEAVYRDRVSMELGIPMQPATRQCSICGKKQIQDIHCLGLNPPSYVTRWNNESI